jgi:outer membrane lipoprotein SlyB
MKRYKKKEKSCEVEVSQDDGRTKVFVKQEVRARSSMGCFEDEMVLPSGERKRDCGAEST